MVKVQARMFSGEENEHGVVLGDFCWVWECRLPSRACEKDPVLVVKLAAQYSQTSTPGRNTSLASPILRENTGYISTAYGLFSG
jgi:hypothetical protein